MPETVRLCVNGKVVTVEQGTVVAAAVIAAGFTSFRKSVTGQPRAPICGMGICFECRVTINGQAHSRSCQIPCQSEMNVCTE
jgi:sarcosine oxidase subunit alpha